MKKIAIIVAKIGFPVSLGMILLIVVELFLKTGWFDDIGVMWIPHKYKSIDQEINRQNYQFSKKNPYLFTDTVRAEKKPVGYYRIAVLGDSFIWGDGLPYDQAWSHKLEHKILQKYINIEVMSWGLRGWSTEKEFEFLQNHGIKYNLDMLIVGYVRNDPDLKNYGIKLLTWQDDASKWYIRLLLFPLRKYFPNTCDFLISYINTFLMNYILNDFGVPHWEDKLHSEENLQRYLTLLQDFSKYCQSNNISLLFVLTPSPSIKYDKSKFNKVIPFLQQANIRYINLLPVSEKHFHTFRQKQLWANLANPHPGELMTEVFANEVLNYLEQHGFFSKKAGICPIPP